MQLGRRTLENKINGRDLKKKKWLYKWNDPNLPALDLTRYAFFYLFFPLFISFFSFLSAHLESNSVIYQPSTLWRETRLSSKV